jgi:hypothetical protein
MMLPSDSAKLETGNSQAIAAGIARLLDYVSAIIGRNWSRS